MKQRPGAWSSTTVLQDTSARSQARESFAKAKRSRKDLSLRPQDLNDNKTTEMTKYLITVTKLHLLLQGVFILN